MRKQQAEGRASNISRWARSGELRWTQKGKRGAQRRGRGVLKKTWKEEDVG